MKTNFYSEIVSPTPGRLTGPMTRLRCWLLGGLGLLAGLAAGPALAAAPEPSVLVCGGAMMNGDQFSDSVLPVLRQHYAGVKQIVLVLHATLPAERDRMELLLQRAFAHLGGIPAESLHRYDPAGQRALLERADGIFVGGGETFVLLAELYRTGQLELIRTRVRAGVPYIGTSAGANVAGLRIGTTNDFPVTDIPTRTSLGIFPAVINPHHPLPEAKGEFNGRAGKIKIYLQFNPAETVLALGNASIARLHAGRVTVEAGHCWLYQQGGGRALLPGDGVPELTP
jgi:dipeptidase E